MIKRIFATMMSLCLLLGLMPTVALAEGESTAPTPEYVAWIGEKGYETLEAAVTAAQSGDTITLGEGKYTLYKKGAVTRGKDLTFVGQGADKTAWGIGATIPNPDLFGTEYNGDYSFDGAGTITFKNMTLQSGAVDYLGFIRADHTVTENCVINGKTFYWGYSSATFKNTIFNCPAGDYALWTYSSPMMTFDTCTFNSSGKTINVYTDFDAGKHDITVNYKDCTVIGSTLEEKKDKAVMNINDSNMGDYKYIINISGTNVVNGVTPDNLNNEYTKEQKDISCSSLFEFNTKYGAGNSGRTVVNVDEVAVWKDGKMVSHVNSDGQRDNAFTVTESKWIPNADETAYTRTVTKVCDYCGYTEETEETGYTVSYALNGGTGSDTVDYSEEIVAADAETTVKAAPSRNGYTFTGWSDGENAYHPGDELTVTGNTTLTAQWSSNSTPEDPVEPTDTPEQPDDPLPPQTGDNSNVSRWMALMLISCGGFAGTLMFKKKKADK